MAFFTVYSPEGEAPARVQHATHGAAMHQAGRLARANPGHRFFIMRSCGKPVVVEEEGAAERAPSSEVTA